MTEIFERFELLIDSLARLGSPIGRFLRPGSSEDAVRATLGSVRLVPSADLLDWFSRHDGPDEDAYQLVDANASPLELFPGVRPLTLEQATADCIDMRASAEDLGDYGEQFWRADWFPIMIGPNSAFAVECRAGDRRGAAVWRSLSHPGPSETGPVAATIAELLGRWIAEIRAGNVYWHPGYRSLEFRDDEAVRLEAAGLY